jgi:exonuclease SbcC
MAHDNLSSLKNDKEVVVSDLFKIKSDIEYNNKILDSLKNDTFQELSSKIIELKNDKAGLNSSVSSLSKDIGVLTEKIKVNEASIELMSEGRDKSGLLKKDLVLLERISKMLGKGGIQTILLDTIIEDLEVTSNKILNFICNEPAVISLETQRVGSDGSSVVETLDIKINIDGVSHGFKSLSGGEKFRIALALRIALSEVSNRHGNSCLELLLLDEVNSPLDRHGTETLFVNVIKSLESKYKVLIITHDESLKEKFDNVIDVTKVNGKSSIEFGAR